MLDPHGMDPQTVLRFVRARRRLAGQGHRHRLRAGRGRGDGPGAQPEVERAVDRAVELVLRRSRSSTSRRARALASRAVIDTVEPRRRAAGDRRSTCGRRTCARSCPPRWSSTSSSSRAARVCEGARLEQELVAGAPALRRCGHEWELDDRLPLRGCGGAGRRGRQRRGVPGGIDRRRGGRMHRVKVRVVEDALDANNTIARANRADFDRARRHGRQPHELARAPARRRCWRACSPTLRRRPRRACSRATCRARLDADRLASLHVPVTQLNTEPGFGGECHLDANMVRSALPVAAAATTSTCWSSRTSATSSARPSSTSARTPG